MQAVYYYVYCRGILGVKTNIHNFKWIYGSVAPSVNQEQYEECLIKFNVYIMPEKELGDVVSFDKRFQSFLWDNANNTIFYRRTLLSRLKIGYNIKISGNTVEACIGKKYYNLVQNRTMNLHGVYYLLSDIANMLLIKNDYLTLYASAIHYSPKNRGVVCLAPPNTGKTLTASKLCELPNYSFIGEDIIITDGVHLFACPWTSTYRNNNAVLDNSGALGRVNKSNCRSVCETCDLTDLVVLSLGKHRINADKDELLNQMCLLNGYLFNYFSSPIIKILAFFNKDYSLSWDLRAETMLSTIVNNANCLGVQFEESLDFCDYVHRNILGNRL